jgi:ERCC4-related helicase
MGLKRQILRPSTDFQDFSEILSYNDRAKFTTCKMAVSGSIAPGARILCRDVEWLVKSIARSVDGGRIIEAVGVSEFIRGKTARFVDELEPDLKVLDPKETELVGDESSGFVHSLLFLEAHLRQSVPDDQKIYLGQQAAMDVMPYQLIPASKALSNPRQRILIADAVGLGKTLECGILATELIRRGRGKRILTVTTKSMMVQFQKEFWTRFTIPLMRLDSTTIQRIRTRIPGNHNPFHYYDRTIISIDTLKQDREYRTYLEQAHWDIIIIDEAHNVARRGKGQQSSQRSKLAERLATRSDTLILLSATPHDGSAESFASLMNMLDPTAIANEQEYTKEDIADLYVRRFKKDILQDLQQHVPERNTANIEAQASVLEERVFRALQDLKLDSDRQRTAGQLLKTTILKSFLSSPVAGLETVRNRLKRLATKDDSHPDLAELELVADVMEKVGIEEFSKYQRLLELIKKEFKWKGQDPRDRLVIFTGRLETLNFLKNNLQDDLKLKDGAIELLSGSLSDTEQNDIVERFGQENAKVRILIATEVASEGLNLHYLSHKLIHFDIPWSLMTLQQRNGRIDRYGQTRQPEIRYLLTRSTVERMDEVERIIKVLLEKDKQAIQNIGDPSVFMGVFDQEQEEQYTAKAIEQGIQATDFDRQLSDNAANVSDVGGFDIWQLLSTPVTDQAPAIQQPPADTGKLLSLFPSTYNFVTKAVQTLDKPPENLRINEAERYVELSLPKELVRRYERLPKEIKPEGVIHLTDRTPVIMAALEEARREDKAWPDKQYLWDLHPLVEWLGDRCLFRYSRQQSPVIALNQGLAVGESAFVLGGSFQNKRGLTMINRWVTAVFIGDKFQRVEDLATTIERTGLGRQEIPNAGGVKVDDLLPLRSMAIEQAHQYLQLVRKEVDAQLQIQLQAQADRLTRLYGSHVQQLELALGQDQILTTIQEQRRQRQQNQIEKIFADYRDWVQLSMTTETEPYIKLVAVLRRAD